MTNQTETEKPTEIGPATEATGEVTKPKRILRSRCKHCGGYEADHAGALHAFEARPRGFAAMSTNQRKEIASRGGVAAHQNGKAHKWTADEARIHAKAGGDAKHVRRGRKKRSSPPLEPAANHMISNTVEVNKE